MASRNKNLVTKIYDLRTIGYKDVHSDISNINKAFLELKKTKESLNRQAKLKTEDEAALARIAVQLQKVVAQEKELLKVLQDKVQAANAANGANESALKGYVKLSQAYKEAKGSLEELTELHGKDSKEAAAAAEKVKAYREELIQTIGTQNQAKEVGFQEFTSDLTKNIELQAKLKAELAQVRASLKKMNEFSEAAKNSKEFADEVTRLNLQEAKLKQELGEVNRLVRNQTKEALASAGSIDEMRAKLNQLLQVYDGLTKEDRTGEIGQKLQKQIDALTGSIKEQEYATGRFQRNVGNYADAFRGYANTLRGLQGPTKLIGELFGFGAQEADNFRTTVEHLLQALSSFLKGKEKKIAAEQADIDYTQTATRVNSENASATFVTAEANTVAATSQDTLATATTRSTVALRIFRGVMLTLGIGIAIGVIALLVKSIIDLRSELKDAERQQQQFLDISRGAADIYGREKAQLDTLVTTIKQETTSRKDKLTALQKLKEQYPGYFDGIKTEKDLLDKLPTAYEKATQGVLAKAKAQAAADLLAKNSAEKLRAEIEFQEQQAANSRLFDLRLKQGSTGNQADFIQQTLKSYELQSQLNLERYNKRVQEIGKSDKLLLDTIKKTNEEIDKLGGQLFDPKAGGGNDGGNRKSELTRLLAEEEEAALKILKTKIQRELELQKAFAKAEGAPEGNRIDARKKQFEEEVKLELLERKELLKQVDQRAKQEKEKKGVTEAEKLAIDRRAASEREQIMLDSTGRISMIEANSALDVIKIRQSINKATIDDADKYYQEQQRRDQERIDKRTAEISKFTKADNENLEIRKNNALDKLNQEYTAGKISKEQYEAAKVKIEKDARKAALNIQLTYYENLALLYEGDLDKVREIQAKVAAIRAQISEGDVPTGEKKSLLEKLFGIDLEGDTGAAAAQAISESYALALQVMNSFYEAERQQIERNLRSTIERMDLEKEQRLAVAQSAAERESIEKEFNAKRKAEERKAFEAQKKSRKAEARLALQAELASIWASVWKLGLPAAPILGGIFSALAVARTALRISEINREQFAFGGVPKRGGRFGGKRHSEGGTPFRYKDETFEAEIDELAIVRTRNAPKNRVFSITGTHTQIASKLNQLGGGIAFEPGAKLQKFEYGGSLGGQLQPPVFVPSSTTNNIISAGISQQQFDQLTERIEALAKAQSERIDRIEVVQVTDTVTKAQRKRVLQDEIGSL